LIIYAKVMAKVKLKVTTLGDLKSRWANCNQTRTRTADIYGLASSVKLD
jgi:hypothetical protein